MSSLNPIDLRRPIGPLLATAILAMSPAAASPQTYRFFTIAGRAGPWGSADGTNNAARFFHPSGVTVDGGGNVYVGDSANDTIRKLTPIGTNWVVRTIAGAAGSWASADGTNNAARFSEPYGVAVDGSGNVYVADMENCTIRKVAPVGTNWVVSTIAGSAGSFGYADGVGSAARFDDPWGVAVDSGGNVYVADYNNSSIRKVTPVGTNWIVSTIAGVYWSSGSADGPGGTARFYGPSGIAVGSNGNVYVADTYNYTIRKLAPTGTNWFVSTIAGLAGSLGYADGTNSRARFAYPYGVAVDSRGNVYVADEYNDTVRKLMPEGTNWVVTTIAGLAGSSGSADGTGSAARFYGATGVAIDSSGNVFVADTYNNTIRRGIPSGVVPLPPVLQTVSTSNGMLRFTWSAVVGTVFQVQYKTNLGQADWTNLGSTITATGSTATASDPVGPDRHRFYRVAVPP